MCVCVCVCVCCVCVCVCCGVGVCVCVCGVWCVFVLFVCVEYFLYVYVLIYFLNLFRHELGNAVPIGVCGSTYFSARRVYPGPLRAFLTVGFLSKLCEGTVPNKPLSNSVPTSKVHLR